MLNLKPGTTVYTVSATNDCGTTSETVTYQLNQNITQGQAPNIQINGLNNSSSNNNPIVIELGCGKGEYSLGLAKMFPEKNEISRQKIEIENKNSELMREHKYLKEKNSKMLRCIRCTYISITRYT